LPITALRVMPPSSAAIWLADSRRSIASSASRRVHQSSHGLKSLASRRRRSPDRIRLRPGQRRLAPTPTATTMYASDCPPHEMSYLLIERLQYGESQAQESERPRPHVHPVRAMHPHLLRAVCRRSASSRRGAGPSIV
jgi:hypothetical protein